jgi:GNAT superfamily N-acetyltransferase
MTNIQETSTGMDGKVEKAFDGSVRQATAADAALLAELGKQSFYEAFCEMTSPEDMAAYLQSAFNTADIEDQIMDERSIFFIADADELAAGYVYACPTAAPDCIRDTTAIQLVRLYLRKKFYGRAVGDALMQVVIDRSRACGYQSIWLSSWELNHRANAFYSKWQFEIVGRQKFTVGSDIQDDYILSRKI